MRIAALLLSIGLVAVPSAAVARGHHGLFGGGGPRGGMNGGHHGHSSINSWMGSHRPRLR